MIVNSSGGQSYRPPSLNTTTFPIAEIYAIVTELKYTEYSPFIFRCFSCPREPGHIWDKFILLKLFSVKILSLFTIILSGPLLHIRSFFYFFFISPFPVFSFYTSFSLLLVPVLLTGIYLFSIPLIFNSINL